MKARTVFAALALTAGLAFTQAPAQATDIWYNVRPVHQPVSVTTVTDPMIQPIRWVSKPVSFTAATNPMVKRIGWVSKPVKACFKGKKLVPCVKAKVVR
jgi:hypothetical protein